MFRAGRNTDWIASPAVLAALFLYAQSTLMKRLVGLPGIIDKPFNDDEVQRAAFHTKRQSSPGTWPRQRGFVVGRDSDEKKDKRKGNSSSCRFE